ncbi:lactate utilization protein C [Campylobacter sp. MIT 21-1685]|uniref:LutC/YkgG family protein n=1 Tax=unclassified Campylobacter TaxID=2593542 RepID=UPI00224A8792|nr:MULTISPECIES: lactate utilization protein C [unclassified Campylobacter]MCX2683293.1 lactate utilization protein C [Campylobacter sp. MIT 21-1684]MCX2751514.1 lactate utilization protein C [Campylobacter sp. MIT 21-1682]MCX2807713.1 lactate utilization protein C [Campylobacter sp. MIT 21-1685]
MSRIEEISVKSKENILKKLENAYTEKDFQVTHTIDPVEHIQNTSDALIQMKQKMSDNKFIVEEASADTLEKKINEIVAIYGYKKLLYPANIPLDITQIQANEKICFDKDIEELRHEVFNSDFSIVQARAGVSSHGVALVVSSKEQPRMLSLAPKLCIMLLKKENVVQSLSQALHLIKDENEILPSNILFIAGPSRTADIELITVFGVHGPQKVHIIIY